MAGLSLGLTASGVAQNVCWDQRNYDESAPAVIDQEVEGAAQLSTYGASDMETLPGGPSYVFRVTVYYTYRAEWVGVVDRARFNVFSKSDTLPFDHDRPQVGSVLPVEVSRVGRNTMAVTGDLSFVELPGNRAFWFVLTPIADSSLGEAFHRVTTAGGSRLDHDAARNPDGGRGLPAGTMWGTLNTQFGTPSDRDLAIFIEGKCIPEPATLLTLGGAVVALAVRAQRKPYTYPLRHAYEGDQQKPVSNRD